MLCSILFVMIFYCASCRIMYVWRRVVVVTALVVSAKLLYVEPG